MNIEESLKDIIILPNENSYFIYKSGKIIGEVRIEDKERDYLSESTTIKSIEIYNGYLLS